MNLLLDIEGTVIESLGNPRWMDSNIEQIQKAIKITKPETFTIFSFAWHEHSDIDGKLMNSFHEIFGMPFQVFPKNLLMPIFKKHFGIRDVMDFHDMCNSKEMGFMMLLKEIAENPGNVPIQFKPNRRKWGDRIDVFDFFLIDDRVSDNSNIEFKNNHVIVQGSTCTPTKLF